MWWLISTFKLTLADLFLKISPPPINPAPSLSINLSTISKTKNIFVSTDNAVNSKIFNFLTAEPDDSLALAILLKAHKDKRLNILGISSIFGNLDGETTYQTTQKQIQLSGLNIKVSKGALFAGQKDSETVNDLSQVLTQSKGKIGLIALGPVTDYATVFNKYPELIHKVAYFLLVRSGPYRNRKFWLLNSFNALLDIPSAISMYKIGGNQFAMGEEIFTVTLNNSQIGKIQKINHPMIKFISKNLKLWNFENRLIPRKGYLKRKGNMTPWDLVWVMFLVKPDLYEIENNENYYTLHARNPKSLTDEFIGYISQGKEEEDKLSSPH